MYICKTFQSEDILYIAKTALSVNRYKIPTWEKYSNYVFFIVQTVGLPLLTACYYS